MDVGEDSLLRDCESHNLWALPETVLCALRGCVACAYKLVVTAPTVMDGERLQPKCHKNLRPEMCPRQRPAAAAPSNDDGEDGEDDEDEEKEEVSAADALAAEKEEERLVSARRGLYRPSQRILVLGDGDFTFALALANSLGPDADLLCTSFQTKAEVTAIYKDASATLASLGEFSKVKVQHGVDATRLDASLPSGGAPFDRVIFNFPCVPDDVGLDGQTTQLPANKALIKGALSSAAPFLRPASGEVHIVHKTRDPFSWWEIPKLLESDAKTDDDKDTEDTKKKKSKKKKKKTEKTKACVTCRFERSVVFDRSLYPGYIPRKVGENKSFPVFDAVTYCFVQAQQGDKNKNGKAASKATSASTATALKEEDASTRTWLLSPDIVRAADLVKLNERRMRQVVGLLQLSAADKFPVTGNRKRTRQAAVATVTRHVSKKMKRRNKRRSKNA